MSRSFKKNPVVKSIFKTGKKAANRKVRRSSDIPNGCTYRKVYPTWDVVDNVCRTTLMEAIVTSCSQETYFWWKESDLQEDINHWFKTYFWK